MFGQDTPWRNSFFSFKISNQTDSFEETSFKADCLTLNVYNVQSVFGYNFLWPWHLDVIHSFHSKSCSKLWDFFLFFSDKFQRQLFPLNVYNIQKAFKIFFLWRDWRDKFQGWLSHFNLFLMFSLCLAIIFFGHDTSWWNAFFSFKTSLQTLRFLFFEETTFKADCLTLNVYNIQSFFVNHARS